MSTLLLIILIVLLLGRIADLAIQRRLGILPERRPWLVVLIVIVLLLMGRI